MSTFEADLRDRAEASVPRLSLDVHRVLAAGRRRRRERLGGLMGATAAVVVGGVLVTTNLHASVAPTADSVGPSQTDVSGTSIPLQPGVRATSALAKLDTPSGIPTWDLGLTPKDQPSQVRSVLRAATPEEIRQLSDDPAELVGVTHGMYNTNVDMFTADNDAIVWSGEPIPTQPTPVQPAVGHLWTVTKPLIVPYGDSRVADWMLLGSVPVGMHSPRAVLLVPGGLGAGRDPYVEVPLFPSPVKPYQLMYSVLIDASQIPSVAQADPFSFRPVVLFVDNKVPVDPNEACAGQSLESCTQALLSIGAQFPGQ